jgi:hypothetical protein
MPASWRSSLWLAVLGALTMGFGTIVYGRKRSPRLGLYAGAVFLAGAASRPRPIGTCCSRSQTITQQAKAAGKHKLAGG